MQLGIVLFVVNKEKLPTTSKSMMCNLQATEPTT